jgi:CHAD domain-containing protein
MKYHPFSIIIKLLQHILDIYQACSNTDLKTIEKILLLKTYYNLGLFLYVNGQNYESIQNLSEARNILNNIHHLPLTKEIMNNINEKSGKINEISEVDSPLINKAYLTKNSSHTTIDEI